MTSLPSKAPTICTIDRLELFGLRADGKHPKDSIVLTCTSIESNDLRFKKLKEEYLVTGAVPQESMSRARVPVNC